MAAVIYHLNPTKYSKIMDYFFMDCYVPKVQTISLLSTDTLLNHLLVANYQTFNKLFCEHLV